MLALGSKLNHLSSNHLSNLEVITNRIIDTGKAEIIILFGFFAFPHRKAIANLPYEILVITDHHETRENLSLELSGAFRDNEPSVNGVIETITLINIHLELGLFYFSDILREGIVLYNNEEFDLSKPGNLTPPKRRKIAESDYKEWNAKAIKAWDCFTESEKSGNIQGSAFYLNQVVEFCYTAIEMVFSHNHYDEHNIKTQRNRIRAFHKRIHEAFPLKTPFDEKSFEELSKAYVTGQYVSAKEFSIQQKMLASWAQEASKLLAITMEICEEKVQRLKWVERKLRSRKK